MATYITSDGASHQGKAEAEVHELSLKLVKILEKAEVPINEITRATCLALASNYEQVRYSIRVCKGER